MQPYDEEDGIIVPYDEMTDKQRKESYRRIREHSRLFLEQLDKRDKAVKDSAKNTNKVLKYPYSPDMQALLTKQTEALDATFKQLITEANHNDTKGEYHGKISHVRAALRAQEQCLRTAHALYIIEERMNRINILKNKETPEIEGHF